ncbi:DUF551 domain-containing protein [Ferrimonas marina]|uniref:DUF551 domain-containing protein n=1 Tax=Ferrimonas marina TaxID=299255 RepID=A0A1M5TPT2_9GAMM|nr:DUF551 domain-containing protein [Ferrimonas marina]SHH52709.1 Protein of unknown function [Ferrimonas marina]
MEWISVKEALPAPGKMVMVFRPQVLEADRTDLPVRESYYCGRTGRFACHHQPTMWLEIKEPPGFTEAMRQRQYRG